MRESTLDPLMKKNEESTKSVETKVEHSINNINKYVVVRVLRDIPTFLGADGLSYRLKAEDVVTLPESNAEVLIKKGIALPVKYG